MSTTRTLDEIKADALAVMNERRDADLPALLQELGRREHEILSEKLGRNLEAGTPEAEAELWLDRRDSWTHNDPRWSWLRDFVNLIEHVGSVAGSGECEEHDAAWFVHATGALVRLVPTLVEVFDINDNHQAVEARETALVELDRITVAVRDEGADAR